MRRVVVSVFGALILLPVWTQASEIVVQLRTQANVAGLQYTLGDVAQIAEDDSSTAPDKTALAETVLGVAPRIGHAEVIPRAEIARVIERSHPALRGRIRWDGAQAVTVRSQGLRYDRQALLGTASAFLQAHLVPDFERVDLTPAGRLEDLQYPLGELSITPRLGQPALNKRMCVWLDVRIDGKPYRSVPVWFGVQAYRPVWVAKRALAAQRVVGPQDVIEELREVAGVVDAVPAAPVWHSARLKRPLATGEVLRRRDLEPVPAVSRAQDVRVRVAAGAVEVETQGRALADGRIGDRIEIASPKNQATYFGRVVGEGVVLVDGR